MIRASRTVTQPPWRSGRRDVTNETFPDAGVTAASPDRDVRERVRTRPGRRVEPARRTSGRFGGDVGTVRRR